MEDARAAKRHKRRREVIQFRFRSGSKDRDVTRLKHDLFQTKAEVKARISEKIVPQQWRVC
jgi:hypothetical protein